MKYGLTWENEGAGTSQSIELFLKDIVLDCEEAEINFLRKSANIIKEAIIHNLKILKRSDISGNYKHMADDVITRTVKDDFGSRVVRVRGGQKTGTLWHIVNDGTYRTRATHFIDSALTITENEIDALLDAEMKKAGF